MKTIFLLLMLFITINLSAQKYCGISTVQDGLEQHLPQVKTDRMQLDAKVLATDIRSYLKKVGATTRSSLYTGTIYEIPVVVHVIEPSSSSPFSSYTVTDAQIQAWVDNTNKMYATTYKASQTVLHESFAAEGTGIYSGTVMPFKLVLAKRTPQCQSTNGIVRVSGSSLTGYDQYGVNYSNSNGAAAEQVRNLSPHWPEGSYFNIYVITTFDANTTTYGLMGWCYYPTNPDPYYESFMKVAAVKNSDDTTLAHEFGHGLGLIHPFDPANSQGGECPENNDCSTDNDKVCDTECIQSMLNKTVYPSTLGATLVNFFMGKNPCTSANYQGGQYNVMNYTSNPIKFTPGQRDRALAVFLQSRGSLTSSLGATDLSASTDGAVFVSPICSPAGVTNPGDFNVGPTSVSLGTINNPSGTYMTSSPQYYIDYSSLYCFGNKYYTDLTVGAQYTLSVGFATNSQWIKAWIDYNNDGNFDDSELIVNSNGNIATSASPYTATFTPSSNSVTDTYLRMRVRSDIGNYGPCDNLNYGQVEDYSVRILSPTTAIKLQKASAIFVSYNGEDRILTLFNGDDAGFGNYTVYDLNGKSIQSGYSGSSEIHLLKALDKGAYILKFSVNSVPVSKKFVY